MKNKKGEIKNGNGGCQILSSNICYNQKYLNLYDKRKINKKIAQEGLCVPLSRETSGSIPSTLGATI